jgi:hypothetical protein
MCSTRPRLRPARRAPPSALRRHPVSAVRWSGRTVVRGRRARPIIPGAGPGPSFRIAASTGARFKTPCAARFVEPDIPDGAVGKDGTRRVGPTGEDRAAAGPPPAAASGGEGSQDRRLPGHSQGERPGHGCTGRRRGAALRRGSRAARRGRRPRRTGGRTWFPVSASIPPPPTSSHSPWIALPSREDRSTEDRSTEDRSMVVWDISHSVFVVSRSSQL